MEFFLWNKREVTVKTTTKIQLSQKHYWRNFKITDHKYQFWILKIITFLADIDYLVKLLSNHLTTLSPLKPCKYNQLCDLIFFSGEYSIFGYWDEHCILIWFPQSLFAQRNNANLNKSIICLRYFHCTPPNHVLRKK